MYQLLSICLVLHPQHVDESIQQALREKNLVDKIARMQSGDLGVRELLFSLYLEHFFVVAVCNCEMIFVPRNMKVASCFRVRNSYVPPHQPRRL